MRQFAVAAMVVGVLCAGCSGNDAPTAAPPWSTTLIEPGTTTTTSTGTTSTTTSSTTIDEQYDSLTALAFDDDAIYGRWMQTSRTRKTDRIVRFDRATGNMMFVDTVTSPLAALRAGPWLFVVVVVADDRCVTACTGQLLRLDPRTMHIEQSLPLDRVTASLTLVGNTLWVPTAHGVVRVAVDTGEILPRPVGEFADTETIVGLTATDRPRRVYAAIAQGQDRFALAAFDPTSGHVTARGPTIGSGPGGGNISHGADGLWFSITTGMLGFSAKIDPDTLTRLDVRLDSQARPKAHQGVGVLWVDESWGGFLSCADPATGAMLWRTDIQTNPVSFARDTTGRMTPFQGWKPVVAPPVCAHG